MQKRTLILLAAAAAFLCVCACVAIVLVTQFMPLVGKQVEQAVQTAAPTVAAVATQAKPPLPVATQAKPALPVPTQQPSGSTSVGSPFTEAINKAKGAAKYRVEFAWIFGGTEQGKYQETPFFDMSGEVDGKNTHFVSKGGLLSMLAAGSNVPIEFIEADGKTYMKGISLFGLTDPKVWYISDDKTTSSFKDYAQPDEFRDFAGATDADFKKTRSESLDGKSCDVWVYDFKGTQNTAILAALGMAKDRNEFSVVDKAEDVAWLCNDGFIHKWNVEFRGHDSRNANEKGALVMTAHMWDFNNPAIVVVAPKDAKPMPK